MAAWQRLPPPPARFSSTARAQQAYPYVLNIYSSPQFQQVPVLRSGLLCTMRGHTSGV